MAKLRRVKKKVRNATIDQIALTLGKKVEDFCTQIEEKEEGGKGNEF
ncbi:hypothetical protein V8V54_26485 [Priestia megaterium]